MAYTDNFIDPDDLPSLFLTLGRGDASRVIAQLQSGSSQGPVQTGMARGARHSDDILGFEDFQSQMGQSPDIPDTPLLEHLIATGVPTKVAVPLVMDINERNTTLTREENNLQELMIDAIRNKAEEIALAALSRYPELRYGEIDSLTYDDEKNILDMLGNENVSIENFNIALKKARQTTPEIERGYPGIPTEPTVPTVPTEPTEPTVPGEEALGVLDPRGAVRSDQDFNEILKRQQEIFRAYLSSSMGKTDVDFAIQSLMNTGVFEDQEAAMKYFNDNLSLFMDRGVRDTGTRYIGPAIHSYSESEKYKIAMTKHMMGDNPIMNPYVGRLITEAEPYIRGSHLLDSVIGGLGDSSEGVLELLPGYIDRGFTTNRGLFFAKDKDRNRSWKQLVDADAYDADYTEAINAKLHTIQTGLSVNNPLVMDPRIIDKKKGLDTKDLARWIARDLESSSAAALAMMGVTPQDGSRYQRAKRKLGYYKNEYGQYLAYATGNVMSFPKWLSEKKGGPWSTEGQQQWTIPVTNPGGIA